MDAWTDDQMRQISFGGNRAFSEFMRNYDLGDEDFKTKYGSVAAEFYRKRLQSFTKGVAFEEATPDYSSGREQIAYH